MRILVIMLRRIGDVLLTTPAVRAIRKLYPNAEIDFLVEPPCHEILEGNPDITRILIYDRTKGFFDSIAHQWRWARKIRQTRYDWVIDYLGTPRSAILTFASGAHVRAGPAHASHRWAYSHPLVQSPTPCYTALEKIRVLRSLGLDPDESDCLPRLHVPPQLKRWAGEALRDLGVPTGARPIGLIPASRRPTRQWPAASYAALGRMLQSQGLGPLLVFWGPEEEALAAGIVQTIGPPAKAAPRTQTLQELSALLSKCRFIVTNCNGPRHMATALGIPTLTIHGSSDPVCWNPPHDPRFQIIRKDDLFCIGCRLNTCPYHLECLRDLGPETVALKAQEMLQKFFDSPSLREVNQNS